MIRLILASASPRRKALLAALGLDFDVIVSRAEETFEGTPESMVVVNARAKRDEVIARLDSPAVVIAADTLVFLGGEIMGKPTSRADAERMLTRLQGRTHQVVTGISLIHLRAYREKIFAVSTDVMFHPLDAGQIRDYLAKVHPLDKAGAYAIQEHGEKIIAEISGSYSNVIGLPLERLREEIQSWAAS